MCDALGVDDPLALAKLLQGPFRFFEFLAQSGQPFGQPGTSLLSHGQAGIHIGLDETFRNPVGGFGGKLLVRMLVADLDQLAIAYQFDGQFLLETSDDCRLKFRWRPLLGIVLTEP